MDKVHSLSLKIDANAAKRGADQFVGAIKSVKAAIVDLERNADGTFQSLQKGVKINVDTRQTERAVDVTKQAQQANENYTQSAKRLATATATAMRVSQNEVQRLEQRLRRVGATDAINKLNSDLARLKQSLVSAQTPTDVRAARSDFSVSHNEIRRQLVATEELALAQSAAARGATEHSARLDSLRQRFNPLYGASKSYESALEDIAEAERAGVISAQLAADARQRAAQQLAGATAAVDQNTAAMARNSAMTQQGIMAGHQLSDVLITSQMGFQSVGMIALQQGSQLSAQLQSIKAAGGSVFRTLLAGFTSLLNPLSLAVIGVTALGAAIAKWMFSAAEETKSFGEAMGDAQSALSAVTTANGNAAASVDQLRERYGAANAELDAHLEKLRQISLIEAQDVVSGLVASGADPLFSDSNPFTSSVDEIRRVFDTTNDRARTFISLLDDVERAQTFDAQARAVATLRREVESTTGGLSNAEGEARAFLIQLIKSEDIAKQLTAAQDGATDSTHRATGAASSLAIEIGTAANAAADLLTNLGSVPSALSALQGSVTDQIAGIQATNRSLEIQLDAGLSSAAANRTVQLEQMVAAAQSGTGNVNFDQIAGVQQEINALEEAAQATDNLRERLRKSRQSTTRRSGGRRSGGGGSRTAELSAEAKATNDLNDTLKDRLSALTREATALDLLASGQVRTREEADLMAQAMETGGGVIDQQTASVIAQIGALDQLNDRMRRLSADPVNAWVDSVPTWTEAGRQIEADAIGHVSDSLSELMTTGRVDLEQFGESILRTVNDVVADMAVKEFMNLIGLPEGFDLGDTLQSAFGHSAGSIADPVNAVAGADGTQAATMMQTAMQTGGSQAAAQMRAAMTGAAAPSGAQMGAGVTTGALTGGTMMGTNITTSGQGAALQMQQAITAGGAQAAAQMGQASSGNGGGGGAGGWAGIGLSVGMMLLSSVLNRGYDDDTSDEPEPEFRPVASYDRGTANTSGIPAMLHDNEAVIPLNGNRKVPVEMQDSGADSGRGGNVINVTQNITTQDADSFRRSSKQVAQDAYSAGLKAHRSIG